MRLSIAATAVAAFLSCALSWVGAQAGVVCDTRIADADHAYGFSSISPDAKTCLKLGEGRFKAYGNSTTLASDEATGKPLAEQKCLHRHSMLGSGQLRDPSKECAKVQVGSED